MIHSTDIESLGVSVPRCRTILIVDDLIPNLDVLEALLDHAYFVLRAESGPEALELIEGGAEIDLVISDQRMPDMTGLELMQAITERRPEMERIVLTAYADIAPIVEAIRLGSVRRFMLKPWDADEMMRAVEEALASRQKRLLVHRLAATLERRIEDLRAALAERDSAVARLELVERLALVGRMAAGVSHDMRNQLTVLQLIVERFSQLSDDPQLQHRADEAVRSLRALLQLVQNVTSFARRQPLRLQISDMPSQQLVDEVLRLGTLERDDARHRVTSFVSPDAPSICGDVGRLTQATLALLRTALAESDDEVELHVARDGQHTVVRVVYCPRRPTTVAADLRMTAALHAISDDELAALGWTVANLVAGAHGGRLDVSDDRDRRVATLHIGAS